MAGVPEVLVITHKYPPSIGGMQKHCFELVEGLKKHIKVHTLIHEHGTSKLLFFLTAVKRAKKILSQNPSINLIYVNDGLMAFAISPILKKTMIPVVATIHGLDVVFPLRFFQKWVRKTLSKFESIIAVSQATMDECIARGLSENQVFMIKNGFDPIKTNFSSENENFRKWVEKKINFNLDGKKIIISIGRAVKRKGFSWFMKNVLVFLPHNVIYITIGPRMSSHTMISIMNRLLPNKLVDLIVLFGGISIDELEINKVIKKNHLEERTFHLQGLNNEEISKVIETADLSVMPNLKVEGDFEGFGLVALEAASKGTICVASAVDGITSAIEDNVNGLLVESGNKEEWLKKITELLNRKDLNDLSQKFQKNTLQKSSSWEDMIDDYLTVFKKSTH